MSDPHRPYWPASQPRHLSIPATNVHYNLQVSAARYPDKAALVFYDTAISYLTLLAQTETIAAYLQQCCGVKAGDRVLLYMQNSVQFVQAFYGILRANAVVVPVNPMNMTAELRHYVEDTGATTVLTAQDLYGQVAPLLGQGLEHAIVAAYSDYVHGPAATEAPPFVAAPRIEFADAGVHLWRDMLASALRPSPLTAGPDDLCVMPYTSGTTGKPKGCMHTHRGVMYSIVASMQWFGTQQDAVILSTLPFFHVTGMQGSMNGPLYSGSTMVILPRWDRHAAAQAITRHRVTSLQLIAAMVVDLLSDPHIGTHDLTSLTCIRGGGAAMPEAVAQKMQDLLGLQYIEGYGMSETMAATHINPLTRPKKQCLGMPLYDVDARLIDPDTLAPVAAGGAGEIVVCAPHVMRGYWNHPQANAEAFIVLDGRRFLRTGDLARIDEDGYFFMVDRLKRMINASGYKVWPAEVEALLYAHPAILEACVIAARDEKRGETVKALVVLKDAHRGSVGPEDIIAWAHASMAAYKAPRIVELVPHLPKSPSGKVQWRQLQEDEQAAGPA
ncbi:MAG: long-chain fatty acid--CoA ligase [Herminiimonas sp.]|nr:long-chain fatty acid--CoA ligase [Herminiimonas sp.]